MCGSREVSAKYRLDTRKRFRTSLGLVNDFLIAPPIPALGFKKSWSAQVFNMNAIFMFYIESNKGHFEQRSNPGRHCMNCACFCSLSVSFDQRAPSVDQGWTKGKCDFFLVGGDWLSFNIIEKSNSMFSHLQDDTLNEFMIMIRIVQKRDILKTI